MESQLVLSCPALEFGNEVSAAVTVCCHYAILASISCTHTLRVSQERMAKAGKNLNLYESSGQMTSKYHIDVNS